MAVIEGGPGADDLAGGTEADLVRGLDGNDRLAGVRGDDTLVGGTGNDTLLGGLGDDRLNAGVGDDSIDGGAGLNTLSFQGSFFAVTLDITSQGVVHDLGGNGRDYFVNIRHVHGSTEGDALTGDAFGNRLSGDAGSDTLDGGDGDDTLDGGDRNDILNGGAGRDTVTYETATAAMAVDLDARSASTSSGVDYIRNVENVIGGAWADRLVGDDYVNLLEGRDGDDTLDGGFTQFALGVDTLDGGAGADLMQLWRDAICYVDQAGDVVQSMLSGLKVDVMSTATAYVLPVRTRNLTGLRDDGQTLTGNADPNLITGGAGADVLRGGGGVDTLVGGQGPDLYIVDDAGDVVVIGPEETALDVILVEATAYALAAGQKVDWLIGEYVGGVAIDQFLTGNELDNRIRGNSADDTLIGGLGNDTLDGGAGLDVASWFTAASGLIANLRTGVARLADGETDQLAGIEVVTGTAFADDLRAGDDGNVLRGEGADDLIMGGAGNDTLLGGAGIDVVSYAGASSAVRVYLNLNQNTLGAGIDSMIGFENLIGSAFSDTLRGDSAANLIDGGSGDDTLTGWLGDDTLTGGRGRDTAIYDGFGNGGSTVDLALAGAQDTGVSGVDTLSGIENLSGSVFADVFRGDAGANLLAGAEGNDLLQGRGGADDLHGGAGADRFVYAALADSKASSRARDTIHDFSLAEGDLIDLSAVDAVGGGADDAFRLVASFRRGQPGQLKVVDNGDHSLVLADLDGDRSADFAIYVDGPDAPTSPSFVL